MRSTYQGRANAAKAYAKISGHHGHVGGWIFGPTGGRTGRQGWSEFGKALNLAGHITSTDEKALDWIITERGRAHAERLAEKYAGQECRHPGHRSTP
jgi:hypothetical protein